MRIVARNLIYLIIIILSLFFPISSYAAPTSNNYSLKEYSFGDSGANDTSSSNYRVNGVAGDTGQGQGSSSNYVGGEGLSFDQQSNVPPAPTLTNPSRYYNKLHLVIANGSNPTDAVFAISISTDAFASDIKYVQADNTVSTSPVWQTYASWGSSTGIDIIGLTPSTNYTTRVAAKQGAFTQTAYGPNSSTVATSGDTLTFSVSPNLVAIGQLTPGSITTAGTTVAVSIDTNGTSGGSVWMHDANSGLLSTNVSHTISAVSNNLTGVSEGYGVQGTSPTQSSGGPITVKSPYNGGGTTVGTLDTTQRMLSDTSNQPVVSGSLNLSFSAKASNTTPAASDYSDVVTLVATANF